MAINQRTAADISDATGIDEEIAEYRSRGFDATTQLHAMDREGLDVAALYPSIGLRAS